MRSPLQFLALPTVIAVGMHMLVGEWWLSRPVASDSSPMTTMLLVSFKADRSTSEPRLLPVVKVESAPSSNDHAFDPVSHAGANTTVAPRGPENVATKSTADLPQSPDVLQLPYLPGEPLIDLDDGGGAPLDGWVELQLSIDETGHVVEHQVKGVLGLPDLVVEKLSSAFGGYLYVPARRLGRSVQSDVTMVISLRDGKAATIESR